MLVPEIKKIEAKKFVGMWVNMSIQNNRTIELFKKFMPRRKEIMNSVSEDVYDLRIFPPNYYDQFSPILEFTKWAAIEVSEVGEIPNGMEEFILDPGEYAVFTMEGLGNGGELFQYIFQDWLPKSEYQLANRPHFDILDEKYQKRHPDATQTIWIPIKPKV